MKYIDMISQRGKTVQAEKIIEDVKYDRGFRSRTVKQCCRVNLLQQLFKAERRTGFEIRQNCMSKLGISQLYPR